MKKLEGVRRPQDFSRKLTKEENEVILDKLRLIDSVIKNHFKSLLDKIPYEDLYQEGYIGLHRAIITKTDKSKLTTWAYQNIRWDILHYLNTKETPLGIYIPLNYMEQRQREIRVEELRDNPMTDKERFELYNLSKDTQEKLDLIFSGVGSTDSPVGSGETESESLTLLELGTTENVYLGIPQTEEIALRNLEVEDKFKKLRKTLSRYKTSNPKKYAVLNSWMGRSEEPQIEIARDFGLSNSTVNNYINDFIKEVKSQEVALV